MGADGGLQLMSLKIPLKYDRLIDLIAPFKVDYYSNESSASRLSRDSCSSFLLENPEYTSGKYLIGIYGTDLRYEHQNLHDLISIYQTISNKKTFLKSDINPYNDTFIDLLLEKETRPWDSYSPRDSITRDILNYITSYGFYKYNDLKDERILNMTLSSWANELNEILDMKSYISIETWT